MLGVLRMLISRPELLTINVDRDVIISHYVPTLNNGNLRLWEYEKKYPLPSSLDKTISYRPEVSYLLLTKIIPSDTNGWQRLSSTIWSDSEKHNRDLIVQNSINSCLRRKRIMKLGRDWVFDSRDVEEANGLRSTIYHCASFAYAEVNGTDTIFYDFVRKVRSSMSIGEEIRLGIFPHEKGEDSKIGGEVMVSVANSNGDYSSGDLIGIREGDTINQLMPNSTDTYRDYLLNNGVTYSDMEAQETFLIDVRHGKRLLKYASNRVFRVLRIEDWSYNLKKSISNDLRLKPSEHVQHTNKGRRMLRGLEIAGTPIILDYNFTKDWNVKVADVSNICKVNYQTGERNLLHNGSWFHHTKSHVELHGKAIPKLNITLCVGDEDLHLLEQLKSRTESVLSSIPGFDFTFSQKAMILRGESQTEITRTITKQVGQLDSELTELIVSALRPNWTLLNSYNTLKRESTELNHIHQNYLIKSNGSLKAPNTTSAHEMNACQLLFKLGRLPVPFKIILGDIDLTLAVDIGRSGRNRSRPAMAVAIDRFGTIWGGNISSDPQPGEEMSEKTVRDLFNNQVNKYELVTGKSPHRILVLRDGISTKSEMDAVRLVSKEYERIGIDIIWVTVQKSGIPRLLSYSGKEVSDTLPEAKSYLVTSSKTAWCWTTGNSSGRFPGIPKGFGFTIERNFTTDPLPIEQLSEILIAQAKSSQLNPYANTRLPLTLHLADKMAKALARGSISPSYAGSGFPAC
jgi:hypothetical protein